MKKGQRIVMMFGFEKKNLSNIDDKELKAFKKLAKVYLAVPNSKWTRSSRPAN